MTIADIKIGDRYDWIENWLGSEVYSDVEVVNKTTAVHQDIKGFGTIKIAYKDKEKEAYLNYPNDYEIRHLRAYQRTKRTNK